MLKLINVLTKLVIIIIIDVCQRYAEKDEKHEQLRLASRRERLATQNLGRGYDPLSARRASAAKKTPAPIPLWSPCDSTPRNALDRPVDYVSVHRA